MQRDICTVDALTGRVLDPLPIDLKDILTVPLIPEWRIARRQDETVQRLQKALDEWRPRKKCAA